MHLVLRILVVLFALAPCRAHADVVLLLSDSKPSVAAVAREFTAQYKGRIESYNLNGDHGRVAEIAEFVRESDKPQVVAIGLLAAQAARKYLSSKQVVFCQVLNHEEFDLITPWMKGVSPIPPPGPQFAAWKQLNPNLRRIGVIASSNMSDLLKSARIAARENGMELVEAEVGSDREVMLTLSRWAGKIQGFWLVPDSRVLSHDVILGVMSYSAKQNIQTLVFSSALLKEGALLSGGQDVAEIARLVILRLEQPEDMMGDDVTPLSSVVLKVNARAAERFGLKIPPSLRGMSNVE